MKVAIIRCKQTEEYCPMTTCLKFASLKRGAFEIDEGVELVGVNNCGGCPGKVAPLRAKEMVRRGADTIAFASCTGKGTPINFSCPNFEKMKESVKNAVGLDIRILEYTH